MSEITARRDADVMTDSGAVVGGLQGDALARHNEAARAEWFALPLEERNKVLRSLRRDAVKIYCGIMLRNYVFKLKLFFLKISFQFQTLIVKARYKLLGLRMKL